MFPLVYDFISFKQKNYDYSCRGAHFGRRWIFEPTFGAFSQSAFGCGFWRVP